MRILFDQGTPVPLRRALVAHVVVTAFEAGWSTLQNGELLAAAEAGGFELFVTTDRNLRYQQQVRGRRLAILVLSTTSWPRIQRATPAVVTTVGAMAAGEFVELEIP